MPRTAIVSASCVAATFFCVAFAQDATRTAELKDAQGEELGSVTVSASPKGVILRIEAKGLTPGWHGVHFHEKADCSDPKFQKSGSHVHGGKPLVHGLLNPQAADAGDLPNLYADQKGNVTVELFSSLVSMGTALDGREDLLDADGSALVIHAKPDDHRTQPIGGAGDRVACAVIAKAPE